MSPKLLQKTSNKFLQLTPPENLIPEKRIGKRERFRPRPQTALNTQYRMERECIREWFFSWNTLEKRMPHHSLQPSSRRNESMKLSVYIPKTEWTGAPARSLVAPSGYITRQKISRALGGNLLHHLNQYVRGEGFTAAEKIEWVPPAPESQGNPRQLIINRAWYGFPEDREKRCMAADSLVQQIQSGWFHMIYSLQEKGKAAPRRDRINDDYRNQLAECRKITLIYGNLQKKTLMRTMRRAQGLGGAVDFNFLSLLETRLDVALKRALFFPTIAAARQWIVRGKLLVNNQPKTVSSYLLQPGDIITITPRARQMWRKQCLQSQGAGEFPLNSMKKQRRFLFSPLLMEKWKKWSQLWGNSSHTVSTGHKWHKPVSMRNSIDSFHASTHHDLHSSFNVFAGYLSKAPANCHTSVVPGAAAFLLEKNYSLLLRRETGITSWFLGNHQGLAAAAPGRRGGPGGGFDHLPKQYGAGGTKKQAFHFPRFHHRELVNERKIFGQWLHQQQSHVVDGVFAPRWNKAFVTGKSPLERQRTRRWSCMKPLHLECSYRGCTVIFLYSPQKLAWPTSINVHLLRKALGG